MRLPGKANGYGSKPLTKNHSRTRDSTIIQIPENHIMVFTHLMNSSHATASAATDAPVFNSVEQVRNVLTEHATASAATDAPAYSSVEQARSILAEPILRRRNKLQIASWNVRTLRQEGTDVLTMRALHQYGVSVACLSEVRMPDSGHSALKVPGFDVIYHLYHSGVTDNSGHHGVAIALSPSAQAALLTWEPISHRLARVRLRGSIANISVIAVYSPTLNASDNDKELFYNQLQTAVDRVPQSDILVVAGDWNARTGPADDTNRHVLGRFAVGRRCDNGDRLVNFAMANRLVVTNTRFQHPRRHLVTWYSNDGRTSNQIDYILVRSRWASCVLDSRSYRGADTGSRHGSDHLLVRATLRLRLKIQRPSKHRMRIDVAKTRQKAGDDFRIEMRNRFDTLQSDPDPSPEQEWQNLKKATTEAAHKHLGSTRRRQRDWLSGSTLDLVERTRAARITGSSEYRNLRRCTSRAIRTDRNQHWRRFAEETERAAACGDSRKLYQMVKQASNSSTGIGETLMNKNGTVITNLGERLSRWQEHFKELLNHSVPPGIADQLESEEEYDCISDPPTIEETRKVLTQLRNNKSPGEDGIPAEVYKSDPEIFATWLHRVYLKVWTSETIPDDWGEAIILPFFKKGDKKVCSNYRGISLIDVAAKAFVVLLLKRFQLVRDRRTRPTQSGFRPGRGCTDQIFNLRRTLEQRWTYQQPTVLCFIDFAAAFDSVDRGALWRIMQADGIPEKLLNLIKAYYRSTTARVRAYGDESEPFEVRSGVRQGCPLSPTLFNYAIDYILNTALQGYEGVMVGRDIKVTDLVYADDIVLLGDSYDEIQGRLEALQRCALTIGMRINASKTKVMDALIVPRDRRTLSLEGMNLERVDSFKYLGSTVVPSGQGEAEIEHRIGAARSAFARLQRSLWARREISTVTKGRIYQAIVRSILLYGCETWPVRIIDQRKLEVFDNDCIRRILRCRRSDRIPTATLRRSLRLKPIPSVLVQRRLRWFGHVARRSIGELMRDVLHPTPLPDWRRRAGGQLKTWTAVLRDDLAKLSGPLIYGVRRWNREWLTISVNMAQDRRAWAAMIRDVEDTDGAGSTRPG